MPCKKIFLSRPVIDQSLAEAIMQELRLDQAEGSPDAPLIIEDAPYSERLHVTTFSKPLKQGE